MTPIFSLLLLWLLPTQGEFSRYLFGCGFGSTVADPVIVTRLRDLTVGMGATASGNTNIHFIFFKKKTFKKNKGVAVRGVTYKQMQVHHLILQYANKEII